MIKNVYNEYSEDDLKKVEDIGHEYKVFLSNSKTERECCSNVIMVAEAKGFKSLDYYVSNNIKLKAGDKIYVSNMNKAISLFVIGEEDICSGMNILGAHIDSPRLDLKANPLYEDNGLCYFDTHYYGGIKKYQWVTLPLSLHGVVIKKDLTKVDIVIGEDLDDPVIGITDLLPHLGAKQLKKDASLVIEGEKLDLLIGSKPISSDDKEKDLVKKNILGILKDKYDIEEEDLLSAEIEVVPAGKARDFGLDKSMIMAYGQDDKVCTFTSLKAFLDVKKCKKTIACILVDKEEIGSVGATGMQSTFFENAILEILNLMGKNDLVSLARCYSNSNMLSSDVNAAFDPLYGDVMDKNNACFFNKGVCFSKYTGARGKSGSNDANCEFIARIRNILDKDKVYYQFAELGKVDAGGGGTIAYILANKNVSVIDCGVGVLSMHAPFEVTSKADIYEAYKCYVSFLKNM